MTMTAQTTSLRTSRLIALPPKLPDDAQCFLQLRVIDSDRGPFDLDQASRAEVVFLSCRRIDRDQGAIAWTSHDGLSESRSQAMSTETAVAMIAISIPFFVFAVALIWAERQTRHLGH